jgi:hypothetical protein
VILVIVLTGHVITFHFGQINEKNVPQIYIFTSNLPRQRRKDLSKGMWEDEDQCSFGLSGLVLMS